MSDNVNAYGTETSTAQRRSLVDDLAAVANILSNELMMLMNHMPRMGGPNINERKWGQALAQKLVDQGVLRVAERGEHPQTGNASACKRCAPYNGMILGPCPDDPEGTAAISCLVAHWVPCPSCGQGAAQTGDTDE